MSFIGKSSGGGFAEKSQRQLGQATQTFAQQDRVAGGGSPGKTVGGAITSGAAMAASGAMIGSTIAAAGATTAATVGTAAATGAAAGSVVPGLGTIIGGVAGLAVGLAGYMLS